MNVQRLIEKYKKLEGVWNAEGAELARQIFLEDLKQLDEPEKVKVPQFVAEHIEHSKEIGRDLQDAMNSSLINKQVDQWLYTKNNMETFAQAWVFGYEVEEEKRYRIRLKGLKKGCNCLNHNTKKDEWNFMSKYGIGEFRTEHTRKQLEEAGFGWVFDCPGIEIEEVE
ncbi:MAG: DUF1642 domain-containing protein [Streptococcus mitis]|nr:DUF1642 domain-containing protein [Streptococcus mitis]